MAFGPENRCDYLLPFTGSYRFSVDFVFSLVLKFAWYLSDLPALPPQKWLNSTNVLICAFFSCIPVNELFLELCLILDARTWSWAYWRNDCMCCPLLKDTGIAFRNSSGGSTKLKPGSWSNCVSPFRRPDLLSSFTLYCPFRSKSRLQIVCVFATGGMAARFVCVYWSLITISKLIHTHILTHAYMRMQCSSWSAPVVLTVLQLQSAMP